MSDQVSETRFVHIKKIDQERQVVFGEVYAPNVLDTHHEMMLAEDIEEMAHRFMQLHGSTIDTNHDNIPNGSFPVESFIAKGHPDYTEGAWVLGVKVADPVIWGMIKRGELNGYSFEAYVKKLPLVVEVDITPENFGKTEKVDGHSHFFWVRLNDNGVVVEGRTSIDEGHYHDIRKGTATEQAAGHAHRYFV